ncbi:Uma2 family endonuclease [Pseudonocardia hierapolitana]|uniref:Uma2 family endonuclease n=1 Tax=Pseudonocardia hierapolitana TaxID=1128676 RepID=A0A561SUK0_9PSEU|nr:Uma2 family endonuclease [Pseudonocardia hierapolitana]TWF78548.1 Uma2 family endonuclease [Pseudonocardia hierapolitana]
MALPIPRELMTLDEWDALPEDNSAHYELQEGVLVVSPKPARKHQRALLRLAPRMERHTPPEWEVLPDFEVVVEAEGPATVRAPDLVIVRADGPESRVAAGDVLLAVEIISPGSRKIDLHMTHFEYAEAGIPHYWVVDLDPPAPSITVYGLGAPGDGYVESKTATGELIVQEPFPMRIDIRSLLDRGPHPSEG